MRLASGTIASLVVAIGTLLFVVAVDYSSNTVMNGGRRPPKSAFLRSSTRRRKLYNYSNNNGSSGSYGYTQNDQTNSYSDSSSSSSSSNNDDGQGSSSSNSEYIWANDDASASNYGNDDNSYFNSNKAYQANAYNGRDQSWGGQSVQMYSDDEEPVIEEEGYLDDDDRFEILGRFGGLSPKETIAVAALTVMASLFAFFVGLLACGLNIVDLCQAYFCCGIFSHEDESSGDILEDSFVKLGDY